MSRIHGSENAEFCTDRRCDSSTCRRLFAAGALPARLASSCAGGCCSVDLVRRDRVGNGPKPPAFGLGPAAKRPADRSS